MTSLHIYVYKGKKIYSPSLVYLCLGRNFLFREQSVNTGGGYFFLYFFFFSMFFFQIPPTIILFKKAMFNYDNC